jgi:hypothetical protein
MDQQPENASETSFPGNVLVAASGFIVTGAGWGLFGYLEGELTATSSASVFFTMSILHFVVGLLVFSRQRIALASGVVLAAIGVVIAAIQPQFVLIFTNVVILALLILARGDVAAGKRAV